METQVTFEIHLKGEGIKPWNTSISELVVFLTGVERAIKALTQADAHSKESELMIGLTGIDDGSNILRFTTNKPIEVKQALGSIVGALALKDLEPLPEPARDLVEASISFAKKRNAYVEIYTEPGKNPQARIGPDTELSTPEIHVTGETVIYGVLTRVGGREPKIGLSLDTGAFISCEANLQLAKQLGSKLYDRVCLQGTAEWDIRDWSITAFKVKEVVLFDEIPITDAIISLANAVGTDAWADEEDIVQAINKLRREQ